MAFKDFFLKANAITEQQSLNAAFIDSIPVESPWADGSNLDVVTFSNLYGLSPENLPINRSGAMAIASVAKGRKTIVDAIARMPLQAVRNGEPLPNQPALLSQLEAGVPNFITLSWTIDSMLFYGRAFWLITKRTADNRPSSVRYVPESELETKDGQLVKAFGKNVAPGSYIRFDANNTGFLHYGADVIREAREIETAAREAGASPVPSVVLHQTGGPELPQEKIAAMVTGWSAQRRKRGGGVAFASEHIDVQSMGQHAEALLIDARNYSAIQVGRSMGVPAWALDATVAGTSLNYSNQSSRNRELLDSLTSYIVSIEQTLSLYFPTTTAIKFDTTELLKSDTADRYAAYKVALDAGFLTVDEIRERENLEPLPVVEQVAPESLAEPLPTTEEPS